jgi:hypothetical protein
VPIIQIVWETIKDIQTGKTSNSSSTNAASQSGIKIWVFKSHTFC